ncbi:hypothetical protein K2173_000650 [Erythroxylum novogranatense]|uniref:Glycosyltransferase n=1 Tax=Erythroxylum novogranatense TaxID=1862640 RepID=A0AAV8S7S4_9ROSI|nr:hypothetical protein K2173_000650 [Erythroxylum novogranatense]
MAQQSELKLHVVMFPWFAFGHISPFVQLANKLSLQGVEISFFSAPGNIARIKSALRLTPKAEIIPLPIPNVEGLRPGLDSTAEMTPDMAEVLKKALDLMQPQVKSILSQLKPHFVFFDFAQHWIPKLACELGIKALRFSVYSVISQAFYIAPVRTTGDKIPDVEDMMKPPKGFPSDSSITSIKRFQAENLMYLFKSFDGGPPVYVRAREGLTNCTAAVVKACREMEGPYIDYCATQFQKPFLLAGPLVPDPPKGVLEDKWANWLGQFPAKSVVFCNFGSETFLDEDQIKELAIGLELTGLPFFLVLNFPAELDSQSELTRTLPEGFMERVEGRGIVHTGWVQQALILAHDSVGCYLCHSGFSLVIEALVNDCQLALLPQKRDQFLNSKLIAGDMKAGFEISRSEEDGYFGKDDISEAIKSVMVDVEKDPGKTIRENHKKWKELLLNREMENKYAVELVAQLKAIV